MILTGALICCPVWAAPLSAVFPASPDYQFDPPEPGSYQLNRIKKAPNGTVLDLQGQKRDLAALMAGKISLVSFVYLHCSDENGCPVASATLFDIHDASARLPRLGDKVQLMTISFDPVRDTVGAMQEFAYPITSDPERGHKIGWQVLTTSGAAALSPIIGGFGQAVDQSGNPDTINHLLRLYLVDDRGWVRNVYGLGMMDPRLLLTDIETLLMEQEAGQ